MRDYSLERFLTPRIAKHVSINKTFLIPNPSFLIPEHPPPPESPPPDEVLELVFCVDDVVDADEDEYF